MAFDLSFDVVELAPFSAPPPVALLREATFRKDAWLPHETERLRAMFAADASLDDMAEALGRRRQAVRARISDLGLRRNSSRPWTDWEDAELAKRYGYETAATIALSIGRSPSALYARAGFLRLTEAIPPDYDGWEDEQIRAGYAAGVPVAQIATLLGRGLAGVATRAHFLRLRHFNKPADWSDAEITRALVLAHAGQRYLVITERLAAEGFPPRNSRSFGLMIRKLGYGRGWGRPWTPEEDDLLRQAYADGASLTPVKVQMGRTTCSIRWRAGELGLQGTHVKTAGFRQGPVWTPEEDAQLVAGYGAMRAAALAKLIGRPKGAIYNRAWSLGLVSDWSRAFSAEEDRALKIGAAHGLTNSQVGHALGRDPGVIKKRARSFGLTLTKGKGGPKAAPRLTLDQILALEAP